MHPATQHPTPREALLPWSFRRVLQSAAALSVLALSSTMATSASTGCGTFCEGGFVRKEQGKSDVCEGKCDVAACGGAERYACVDNRCVLQCTSHTDCVPIAQACATGQDDDGNTVNLCKPATGNKAAIGAKCPFGQKDCDGLHACPDGTACDPACSGTSCPCAADQCKPLFCRTSGAADADAYCTLRDCHADTDCVAGYRCATVRDPHAICGAKCSNGTCVSGLQGFSCSTDSDCQKGNNDSCGTTTDPCVDPSQNAQTGATYAEGPLCALRNECRPRRPCSPCATDLDCGAVAGQHCTLVGSENVCTRDCASESDCDAGFTCTNGACVPRFGACVGSGNFCEPCRTDLDCKSDSGTLSVCGAFSGSERVCYDAAFATSCSSDADCPTSPSGLHGICIDDRLGASSGDPSYHRCGLPSYSEAVNRFSCWCANQGSGCMFAKECCSNKCVGYDPTTGMLGNCE